MTQNDTVLDVKKKATIKAYISTFGNVTQTCKSVGIERKTFYRWKEKDKKFAKAIEEAEPEERFLDYLDAKALARINKGSDKILLHALKTKGKKRGWNEKKEIEVSVKPVRIIFTDDDGQTHKENPSI